MKSPAHLLSWAFGIVLLVSVPCFAEPISKLESIEQLFKKADDVKSGNKAEFYRVLEKIENYPIAITGQQAELVLYLKAYKESLEGNFDESIQQYEKIISSSKSPFVLVRAKVSLVNILGIVRDYQKGFYYLESLTQNLSSIDNSKLKSLATLAAAFNYNAYQQYKLSSAYSQKLLDGDPTGRTLCFAQQLNIEANFNLNPMSSSDNLLEKAIQYCVEIGEPIAASSLRTIKARLLLEEKKPEEALDYLVQHESQVRDTGYSALLSQYYIVFAKAKWALKQLDDAEKYANKVLNISDGEEYVKPKVFAYLLLHEIAQEREDFKLALDHYVNYSETDKAQINEVLAQQLAYQMVEHQTDEKVQEIKLLNKQNEVLILEQNLAKQQASNNRLIVLLLIFILAALAFWAYRVKRNQVKLKRQSEIDVLTGISSRHHFYFLSKQNLEYAKLNNRQISFILFDMDSFKSVNDNYGHLVGDWVLKKAIEVCRPCWRQNDVVGRLGGEEFAIMLPSCDLDKAVQIAHNCRKAIESVDTAESGHQFNISASFGVTTSEISGYDLMDLIADADRIMYQAKAAGKNQVLKVASKKKGS